MLICDACKGVGTVIDTVEELYYNPFMSLGFTVIEVPIEIECPICKGQGGWLIDEDLEGCDE